MPRVVVTGQVEDLVKWEEGFGLTETYSGARQYPDLLVSPRMRTTKLLSASMRAIWTGSSRGWILRRQPRPWPSMVSSGKRRRSLSWTKSS